MAITSGFFDAVEGDRLYDADQMSEYFDGLVSDGVYENIGERFAVSATYNGLQLRVGSGRALIRSRWVKNDAAVLLTPDPADVQRNRLDAVVLRLDTEAREITLTIKKGTASNGTPTLPTITRTDTVYELYLASVLFKRGATTPTLITDLRPSAYCGWVTGIIKQVDTSDLFAQWEAAYAQMYAQFDAYMAAKEAAFNDWFSTLTKQLTVDTSITKFENAVTITAMDVTIGTVEIGIDEFDADTDVLFVYLNGAYFTDYMITGGGKRIDSEELEVGDVITFVVLKNVIGGNVTSMALGSMTRQSAGIVGAVYSNWEVRT